MMPCGCNIFQSMGTNKVIGNKVCMNNDYLDEPLFLFSIAREFFFNYEKHILLLLSHLSEIFFFCSAP